MKKQMEQQMNWSMEQKINRLDSVRCECMAVGKLSDIDVQNLG